MAAKKNKVTKKAPTPKTEKVQKAAVAPKTKKEAPDVALVDPASLEVRPKKQRGSALDPIIEALMASPGKAYVHKVLELSRSNVIRTMLYPRVARVLERLAPEKNLRCSIAILTNGSLSVTLVKA